MVDLIGRDRELAEVEARLGERRLVTVIGPGGIGKTSLARAVAERVGHRFELGVHPVDLTRVDSPDAVAGAVAAQLGFASFDALLASPSEQPVLIVLDNCEHVTAAAGDAVQALLAACRSPTVLATSRSPLDAPGESLVVLGPLEVPPPGSADPANPAVALFLERARDAGSSLDAEQMGAVAELCRRLDGLPLALELAAARTRTLSPTEILERLEAPEDVLARPRFRGDRRHRSLRATIDWSYRLLEPREAALFDRLGVFAGPFTTGMALAVGNDVGLEAGEADAALQTLADSSLMVAETGRTLHHRLLEPIRTFALQRLEEHGALEEAHDRFADHVLEAVTPIVADGARHWDMSLFARLLALFDNVTAALRWCLAHDEDADRARHLYTALWGVVHQGHTEEIAALGDELFRRWPDPTTARAADAGATAATARYLAGDPRGAIEMAECLMPHAGSSVTAPLLLRRVLGYAARAVDDVDTSLAMANEVARGARLAGLTALAQEADVNRALLLADRGDLELALAQAQATQTEAEATGSDLNAAWAQTAAAAFRWRLDPTAGEVPLEEALERCRRLGYPAGMTACLRTLAVARTLDGRYAAAAESLSELLDGLVARSATADRASLLETTAALLHAAGRPTWEVLAATAATMPRVGMSAGRHPALPALPEVQAAPISRSEAVTLARRELAALRAEAPPTGATATTEATTAAPATGGATARCVRRGDLWEITFGGRTVHARATKGVADLARLLARPNREVHCLELMGAGVEEHSTGEILDERARRGYEQRIRDLQAELDEAEADHDRGRAERARSEMDAVVDHLTAVLGLGGRSRRGSGSAEKARSAVTQRVRSSIRRLGVTHPDLGRHLGASITTGTFCSYRPEHPVVWEVAEEG